VITNTTCCPSCRRSGRSCDIISVAKCYAALPVCAPGDQPVDMAGECCPTCVWGPPVCSPGCNSTQLCYRASSTNSDGNVTYTPTCAPRVDLQFNLTTTGLLSSWIGELNPDEIIQVAAEFIRRFCDKSGNAAACQAGADELASVDINVVKYCSNASMSGKGHGRRLNNTSQWMCNNSSGEWLCSPPTASSLANPATLWNCSNLHHGNWRCVNGDMTCKNNTGMWLCGSSGGRSRTWCRWTITVSIPQAFVPDAEEGLEEAEESLGSWVVNEAMTADLEAQAEGFHAISFSKSLVITTNAASSTATPIGIAALALVAVALRLFV